MLPRTSAGPAEIDDRWRAVQDTMRRNGFRGDALIETLHTVQNVYGYLEEDALIRVADALNVARSRVHGVATFYHFFHLKPNGKHVCTVCTGTACHIQGGQALLDHVADRHKLMPGETAAARDLTLLTVRCIGACALAPVVTVDGDILGHASAHALDGRLDEVIAT